MFCPFCGVSLASVLEDQQLMRHRCQACGKKYHIARVEPSPEPLFSAGDGTATLELRPGQFPTPIVVAVTRQGVTTFVALTQSQAARAADVVLDHLPREGGTLSRDNEASMPQGMPGEMPAEMAKEMPPAEMPTRAPADSWLRLFDYADGVQGHFCIGRRISPTSFPISREIWEFYNQGQWGSAGQVFTTKANAEFMMAELTHQLQRAKP